MERARAGEDRAFELLYERYRERIHAFILSRVRDHGRAEDLGQEVFISALRQLRANRSEIVFKPWLYTIARNACIDEFRRDARAREVPVEAGELPGGSGVPVGRSAPPTPPEAVDSKQTLQDLRSALDGLGETQHRLLVLREFEGLSYDEIGARLGMTRQMVESGLFRARRKLGEEYDEVASGRRCEQIQDAIDAGALRNVRGLGIKLRRRYSRHLAHCQPCRHVAMAAGIDDALLAPRSVAGRVAGLLPLPALPLSVLRRLTARGGARRLAPRSWRAGGHHAATGLGTGGGAGGAGASGAGVATGAAGLSAGQAAAVAALVIGGAGGGLLVVEHASAHAHPALRPVGTVVPAGGQRAGRQASWHLRDVAVAPARGTSSARGSGRGAAGRSGLVTARSRGGGVLGGSGGSRPGRTSASHSGTGRGTGTGHATAPAR
ncbi:MAG TPA: sigma-70 family RNA polymerase sigma factor, partial [Solirubrobacteraceae bacterium]|nr:sigma-70 family RNA polymerase sigma factor [Solirubrobacteraceae bacterium]